MRTKTTLRKGIGWFGQIFTYGTRGIHDDERVEKLNKTTEFKRAAKKAQRRRDTDFYSR